MKTKIKIYLSAIFFSLSAAQAQNTELLSPQKQDILHQQQNKYEAENEKLRNNWISPLNLNGSYSYDKNANGSHSDTKKISASINQDIFRSGGIVYQINYADAKKRADAIELKQQTADLNEELFRALLNYKKSRYELEQSSKKLDNYDIEIFIKRQLYDVGKADITELNNALMDKSGEQKIYASLEYEIANQRLEIAKLSDIDPESFPLYSFDLVQENAYLQNNFEVRYARAQSQTYEQQYNVTKSSYLPTVALNADAGYLKYDPKELYEGYDGDFYTAGVSINIPLTYNASAAKEEAKALYLKQAADAADRARSAKASYAQSIELIKSYRRYIDISSKNIVLYNELIETTKAGLDAGSKTGYDLKTLENTKAIEEYTIKINEINIELELAKLHFAINADKDIR